MLRTVSSGGSELLMPFAQWMPEDRQKRVLRRWVEQEEQDEANQRHLEEEEYRRHLEEGEAGQS